MPESFVVSDGVSIWTTRTGEGYPVMLCNGGPGCCDYLAPVAGMLDDVARVIRFEQRGCGRSQHAPPYDVETCLKDLESVRTHYGIDRWVIGGHSWGADLALIYALEHTRRVAGLICVSGGRVNDDREWHAEYVRRREQEGEREPHFDYPPNMEVNRQVSRSWKRYIRNPELLRAISRLTATALFVYGERDIRPGWPVEQVAHLMPNARFELIEGAGHVIWFSHPDELKSLLRTFFGEVYEQAQQSVSGPFLA
jgi:proline iminopeptidase